MTRTSIPPSGARAVGLATACATGVRLLPIAAAIALWIPNFGLIDLIDGLSPFVDEGRNSVLDVGWGAVFGLMLPLGLLALLRTRNRTAGAQTIVLIAVVLALAGAAGRAPRYLLLSAAVLLPVVSACRHDPDFRALLRVTGSPRPALLLVAAAGAAPWLVYASRTTQAARGHAPPADAQSNGLHHWPVMAAMAAALVLLVVLAALARDGWPVPALAAALGSLAWGLSSYRFPDVPASGGRGWGVAATAWAALIVAAVASDGRRKGTGPP